MNSSDDSTQHDNREELIVLRILRSLSNARLAVRYRDELRKQSASGRLTLSLLYQRFPHFPMKLGAVVVNEEPPPKPVDLVKRFTRTPYFRAYAKWIAENDIDESTRDSGVVICTNGSTLVLHNRRDIFRIRGAQMLRQVGHPPITLVLESFDSLLVSIGTDWAHTKSH
jgi:hypothetical protein